MGTIVMSDINATVGAEVVETGVVETVVDTKAERFARRAAKAKAKAAKVAKAKAEKVKRTSEGKKADEKVGSTPRDSYGNRTNATRSHAINTLFLAHKSKSYSAREVEDATGQKAVRNHLMRLVRLKCVTLKEGRYMHNAKRKTGEVVAKVAE